MAATPLQSALAAVDRALAAVEAFEPNRFRGQIRAADTLAGQYLAICRLSYAAGGKELRDTSDRAVHEACDRLQAAIDAVDRIVLGQLPPRDAAEAAAWLAACLAVPGGRFFQHDDGRLVILLLDAEFDAGGLLRIRRVFSPVSNSDGTPTDLRIAIGQAGQLRARLEGLRGETRHPFAR